MRMWNVDPRAMCRQHLLGEHLEMHMFVGARRKKKSLQGYASAGLVDLRLLRQRHNELVHEMECRGYQHESPLPQRGSEPQAIGWVDSAGNFEQLRVRCASCRRLQDLLVKLGANKVQGASPTISGGF